MKKLLCLLLALLMLVSVAFVACDKDDENPDDNTDDLAFNPTQSTDADTTDTETATSSAPASYTFTDVDEQVYVKNCLKVNFRSTPSAATNDNIEGSLEFGDEKTYKRVKYNEVWSGLEIDGEIYYVNTEFLTTDDGFVVFDDIDDTIYAINTVSPSGVKVYNFTDTEAEGAQNTTVKHNAPLHATGLSKNGKWYRIDLTYTDEDGKTQTIKNLYIYNGKYVSETASTETAPAE